jgi:hypothetical protein
MRQSDDYRSDPVNATAISKTIDDDRVVTAVGAMVRLNWHLVSDRDTNWD